MRAATFDDFDERLPQRVHSINFYLQPRVLRGRFLGCHFAR